MGKDEKQKSREPIVGHSSDTGRAGPSNAMRIDVSLVRRLIADQFPHWADLAIGPVRNSGHDNRTFRLGDEMSVRLPSAERYAAHVKTEWVWLARLAPHLPLPIPIPVALGEPGHGYPWYWLINRWLEGESAGVGQIGELRQFAEDLANFLNALQRVDTKGGKENRDHRKPVVVEGTD